jgi:hypothetical protein
MDTAEEMGFPRQKVKARRVAPSDAGAERVSNSHEFLGTGIATTDFADGTDIGRGSFIHPVNGADRISDIEHVAIGYRAGRRQRS